MDAPGILSSRLQSATLVDILTIERKSSIQITKNNFLVHPLQFIWTRMTIVIRRGAGVFVSGPLTSPASAADKIRAENYISCPPIRLDKHVNILLE